MSPQMTSNGLVACVRATLLATPALTTMLTPCGAAADEVEKIEVRTGVGQEVLADHRQHYSHGCIAAAVPRITEVEKPQHGRIDVREGVVVVTSHHLGGESCVGSKMNSTLVYYVPQPDFKGPDHFSYDVHITGGPPFRKEISVTVE